MPTALKPPRCAPDHGYAIGHGRTTRPDGKDILDTGYTLDYLYRFFGARKPASLRTCVLLSKPERRKVEVKVDYLGFEIPDVWVVGYGLDFADRFRTLPYIAALKPKVYQK
jgi:hypoxanthine phosphoribosyltransferase